MQIKRAATVSYPFSDDNSASLTTRRPFKMPMQKIKSMLRTFAKGSTSDQREQKKLSLYRLAPLFLLMLYAICSVIRLASSSSYSFYLAQATDSFVAEMSSDLESFTTHISSNLNYLQASEENTAHRCSDLINGRMVRMSSFGDEGLLCCDRSHNRTDVCYMRGDIRTDANSSSISVYGAGPWQVPETIRPYTRKWETEIMSTIDNITLLPVASSINNGSPSKACEKRHGVPGLVFSTGGYTGNLYHEFNDGLIPLFITAQRFHGEVVLVVMEYHSWWMTTYRPVIRKLTNYKVVDFSRDRRVHCFSEMIVGLRIHGELSIDPLLMPEGIGIQDFRALLGQGLGDSQLKPQEARPPLVAPPPASASHSNRRCSTSKPKMTIIIRSKSRVLLNLDEIVKACEHIGFEVQVLKPKRGMPLTVIHDALDAADVMLAVHGAAMTHFLFMRPRSVLIQIVPLGLDWAAETYYGEPARKLGLEYMAYRVRPGESSLSKEYHRRSPVLMDPSIITRQGWWETKRIYLDRQNIKVNIGRFSRVLAKAHSHICKLYASV
ncbi:beta-1,2-xylosyltransferase XYXT1-like [Phoenix dactylifera]|uniref:Beta-1,2-xylosyltransferase XYXT1-like n=1 Tax=Phoenix dactylifera TaxID=42345 RepID=A0A8B8J9I1_PHODC|nr:beta-1,2-xylosyltransferase XYXT1-like [Phoenix dactylifera]